MTGVKDESKQENPQLRVVIKQQKNTTQAVIYVSKISNGFVVKAGEKPAYFGSATEAFTALTAAGIAAFEQHDKDGAKE